MSESSALQPDSSTPIALTAKHETKPDFQQRLKQYAVAALGLAGVSALASAQTTTARHILYTPASIPVDTNALRDTEIPLDLNHDGIIDLSIIASHFRDSHSGGGFNAYGRIWLSMNSAIGSHAIPKGMIIDKAGTFKNGRQTLAYAFSWASPSGGEGNGATGPFANITNKYLGVRIVVRGKTHEGWVRLTLASEGYRISGTITGYAYDTVPNEVGLAAGQIGGQVKPPAIDGKAAIETSSPGSLGMLAIGSSAASYLHR